MPEGTLTREFSICLLPDAALTSDVDAFRQTLPQSPFRDDIPHITLLRGITAGTDLTDEALLQDIESRLSLSSQLPLDARIQAIENKSNQFYSASGLIILQSSPQMLTFRQRVVSQLTSGGYNVEPQELNKFTPHITIRLGVALEGDMSQKAMQLFENRPVTFSKWLLFRLVKDGDKRTMHIAKLTA